MSKTMTDRKLLTILLGALLGICMVMSIGVQNAYADSLDDEETIEYDAIFAGEASLIADEWGDLYLDSDVIEDCSVTIQTAGAAGEDLKCDFKYDEEEGVLSKINMEIVMGIISIVKTSMNIRMA